MHLYCMGKKTICYLFVLWSLLAVILIASVRNGPDCCYYYNNHIVIDAVISRVLYLEAGLSKLIGTI